MISLLHHPCSTTARYTEPHAAHNCSIANIQNITSWISLIILPDNALHFPAEVAQQFL